MSSDSDFTRLAMRLRESGRRVYGIGARKTPQAFTNACDRFTFIEVLAGQPLAAAGDEPARSSESGSDEGRSEPTREAASDGDSEPSLPNLRDAVTAAIEASAGEDGWAILSRVGFYIVNNSPSFDSRNYGFLKLGALVESLPYVEVKEVPDASGFTQLWVRLRSARGRRGR